MKATILLIACAGVLLSPTPLLACGGCTDAVLLMTSPWAGYGILLVWLWIFTMLGVWLADPRPNDYTSEFYWTASSESGLRPVEEIEAAWKEDSASIRKRWEDRFE